MQNPKQYDMKFHSNHFLNAMADYHYKAVVNCQSFSENENILDYACGTGIFYKKYLFEIATKNNSKLVGVDISKAMLEHALANSFQPGLTEYVVGDILDDSNWPFEENSFHKVFANLVIHVYEDYTPILAKLNQCLKPRGTLSAIIPTSPFHKLFSELGKTPFWENHYTQGGSKYFSSWSSTDPSKGEFLNFEPALLSTGFKVKEHVHKLYQLEFEDVYECLSFLITVNGPMSAIPIDSQLYKKLQLDLIEAMKLIGINPTAKPFPYDLNMYHFLAKKL